LKSNTLIPTLIVMFILL